MARQTIGVTWEPEACSEYTLDVYPDDFVGETRSTIAIYVEEELEDQLRQKVNVYCPDFDRYVDEIFAAAQKIEQEEEDAPSSDLPQDRKGRSDE